MITEDKILLRTSHMFRLKRVTSRLYTRICK